MLFRLVGWICLVTSGLPMICFNAGAYTAADAQTMVDSFNNAFYFTTSGRGYFRDSTDGGTTWFWGRANQMEMLVDLYEQTTNTAYLTQFSSLYNGFAYDYGTSWTWNAYNDDIMWMVIACSRAYQKTGNNTYRSVAKSNFDACYTRAWSTNGGGGLYWKYPDNSSKNACVNGPGAIAAYLIYQNYGDTNYLAKAESLYQWERAKLFNSGSGSIADYYGSDNAAHGGATSYNQGTFIGAANFLGYTNDAILAANYTRNSMGTGGQLPNYDENSDLGNFNAIFVRWMVRFMKDRGLQRDYQLWLQQNANAAWNVRRPSDNISWSKWWDQTPDDTRYSVGCWGSVMVMNLVPPTQNPGGSVVTLNTSDVAGSSSFESALNWSDGAAPSSAKNYVVNIARTLRTPADGSHHTFAGSSLTLSNGAVLAFKNTSGGRYVSIGTDLFLDGGEVHNWSGNSASLGGKVTLKAGGGKIDPQGNSFSFPALIGGPGALRIGATAVSPLNGTVNLNGVNTYTGGTVIEAPHTVQIDNSACLGSSTGSLAFSNSVGRGYGTMNLNGIDLTIGKLSGAGGTIMNSKSGTTNTLTIGNGDATGGIYQGIITDGGGMLGVTKAGTGSIALSGANTFSGGMTMDAGQLNINYGGSSSANSAIGIGVLTILANTTLDNTSGTEVTLRPNNAQVWNGNFTYAGTANSLNLGTGAVSLAATRTVTVSGNRLTAGGVISGAGGLAKMGPGTLALTGANMFTGTVDLQAGTLAIGNDSALGTGPLNFNGGTLGATIQSIDGAARMITNAFNFGGSAGANAIFGGTGNLKFTATPNANGTAKTLTVNNPRTEFSGVLGGASARTVAGTGILIFSGANTYSLGTTINPGATLQLGNGGTSGSLSTSGTIDDEGTLIFNRSDSIVQGTHFSSAPIIGGGSVIQAGSGIVTLNAANTYSGSTMVGNGVLGGTGSIPGMLNVQPGGTLAPGMPSWGILPAVMGTLTAGNTTINGTMRMKIDRSVTPTSDKLSAPSVVANAGSALVVTNLGPTNFSAGDRFTLFSVPISGAFNSVNLPPLPDASLVWANNLAVDGSIAVIPAVAITPTNLVAQFSVNTLTLSWPADHTGWRLQTQTNPLVTGLNSNWFDVAGAISTNQMILPFSPDAGGVFFRLIYP